MQMENDTNPKEKLNSVPSTDELLTKSTTVPRSRHKYGVS